MSLLPGLGKRQAPAGGWMVTRVDVNGYYQGMLPVPITAENTAPIRSVGMVVNTEREDAIAFAREFSHWLQDQGIHVCATRSVPEVSEEIDEAFDCLVDEADLVLVMGGDGSLLGASRRAAPAGKLLLGIHWGGLGFLNESLPEQAQEAILRMLRGDYTVEERLMLQAELWRDGKLEARYPALNDVAVTRDTLSRILRLEVTIGGETVAAYHGDGIIVATPTGSTAHSFSAGGPVVDPRVDALTLTPICPHSGNGRAILVPAAERLEIRHYTPLANVIVTVDGQIGAPMRDTDCLVVNRAPWSARFVRLGYSHFYQNLRDKLQLRC